MAVTSTPIQHGSYLMPALEHATVADAMHPGIMTCEPSTTVTEIARMMATHHVHCVAVMGIAHEGAGESLVWGIVSDLDLVRAGLDGGADATAAAIALHPMVSVEPATPLRDAVRLMLTHSAPHLLVFDPAAQRPVGMISTLDVAGIVAWGEA